MANIAERIDATLLEGEIGILFLGTLHQAISKLPAAIEIVPLTEMLEAAATRAKN